VVVVDGHHQGGLVIVHSLDVEQIHKGFNEEDVESTNCHSVTGQEATTDNGLLLPID